MAHPEGPAFASDHQPISMELYTTAYQHNIDVPEAALHMNPEITGDIFFVIKII